MGRDVRSVKLTSQGWMHIVLTSMAVNVSSQNASCYIDTLREGGEDRKQVQCISVFLTINVLKPEAKKVCMSHSHSLRTIIQVITLKRIVFLCSLVPTSDVFNDASLGTSHSLRTIIQVIILKRIVFLCSLVPTSDFFNDACLGTRLFLCRLVQSEST